MEALTWHFQGTGSGSLHCARAAPTQGVVSCTYEQWLSLIAHVGGIVNFLFLGARGACSDFCSLGWAVMTCQLLLAGGLALARPYVYIHGCRQG